MGARPVRIRLVAEAALRMPAKGWHHHPSRGMHSRPRTPRESIQQEWRARHNNQRAFKSGGEEEIARTIMEMIRSRLRLRRRLKLAKRDAR